MGSLLTISIIAPIYGVEKYIGRFAESVLNQSYPNIQFVFVNDGTKDSSIDILKSLLDNSYRHLKDRVILVNKTNAGLPAARKTGLEYATGDYIWHVDSDDWIAEDAVQKIVDFAEVNNCPDVIYFDFYKEYSTRSKLKKERDFTIGQKNEYIRGMYNHHSHGCVWNKCVRRSLYVDHALYYPQYSYAEDTYLMTQLIGYAETLAHLSLPLYHYRKDNPNSITRQNLRKRKAEYARNFIDLYLNYCNVPSKQNPVSVIMDEFIIQASWYSMVYNLGLFDVYPWLANAVSKAKIRAGSNVCILCQILTKLYSYLYK